MAIVSCPECSKKLKVADTSVGKKVKCTCGNIFVAETSNGQPPAPASGDAPQKIVVACTECLAKLKVAMTSLGKKMKCPKCTSVFIAALEGESPPKPVKKARPAVMDEDDEEEIKPKAKAKSAKKDDDDDIFFNAAKDDLETTPSSNVDDEDDAPKPKGKAKPKKVDDDDEDEAPKPKAKAKVAKPPSTAPAGPGARPVYPSRLVPNILVALLLLIYAGLFGAVFLGINLAKELGLPEAKGIRPKKAAMQNHKPTNMLTEPTGTLSINDVTVLALTPDNALLAAGSLDHRVYLWDYGARKEKAAFAGHNGPICSVALSPDGKYFASGGKDLFARLWEVSKEQPIHTFALESDEIALAFTPDGKTLLVSGAHEKNVKLFDLERRSIKQTFEHPGAGALALTPDGKFLAAGSNKTSVWNLATGKKVADFGGFGAQIYAVALTPDAKTLITTSADDVKLWDVPGSKLHKNLKAHTRSVLSLALTPDGRVLASGGADGTVHLWEVETGTKLASLEIGAPIVSGLAISKDGKTLLAGAAGGKAAAGGGPAGSLQLWDLSAISGR